MSALESKVNVALGDINLILLMTEYMDIDLFISGSNIIKFSMSRVTLLHTSQQLDYVYVGHNNILEYYLFL